MQKGLGALPIKMLMLSQPLEGVQQCTINYFYGVM